MIFDIFNKKKSIFDHSSASKFPFIFLSICYWLTIYRPLGNTIVKYLSNEDSFFENLSVILLFLSSFFLINSFFFSDKKIVGIKKYYFLFLSIFFLIWGFEEISWGERIFDFSWEFLSSSNVQGETNLHNSNTFQPILTHSYYLFSFAVSFCCSLKKKRKDSFLPEKSLIYFFLIPGIFYLNAAIISNFEIDIRGFNVLNNPLKYQEINEFLIALGTLIYSVNLNKKFKRNII